MLAHMHFAHHPGYILNRPQEFIRAYGDYVLRMLHIVRKGCEIPRSRRSNVDSDLPNETLENQSDSARLNSVSHLTQEIRSLVDMAIKYLERLSPPRWYPRLPLTRLQCVGIKAFLDIPESDNATGNLRRFISDSRKICWMCQEHAYLHPFSEHLERLSEFANSHSGNLDLQLTSLHIILQSESDLDQFCSLLKGSGYTFDILIKLGWKATPPQVTKLCTELGKTMVLEIDSIDLDTHPPGYVQSMTDHFADRIVPKSSLNTIILLNYPRLQKMHIYTGGCVLNAPMSPTQSEYDLIELEEDGEIFRSSVEGEREATKWTTACEVLQQALTKHEWSKLPLVGVHLGGGKAVFDLEKLVLVHTHLLGSTFDDTSKADVSSGHLHNVTFDFSDPPYEEAQDELDRVLRLNKNLQELNIAISGGTEIYQVTEHVSKMRRNTSGTICLTLFDRIKDDRGRVTAQVIVVGQGINGANSDTLGLIQILPMRTIKSCLQISKFCSGKATTYRYFSQISQPRSWNWQQRRSPTSWSRSLWISRACPMSA